MSVEKTPKSCLYTVLLIISLLALQLNFLKVCAQQTDTIIAMDKPAARKET